MSLEHFLDWFFGPTPKVPPPPTPTPAPASVPEVVRLMNAERAKAGLRPLAGDADMDALAAAWARVMAKSRKLDHGNFPGRISTLHPNTAAAEDIAMGYPDAASVVAGWMASPPHRANILGPYSIVGVGSAVDPKAGRIYWTADFDRP